MMYNRLIPLLTCILLISLAHGQRRPGMRPSTSSQLTVEVITENDQVVSGSQMRVQLLNAGGVPLGERFTDTNGRAQFSGLSSGGYNLRVTGPGFEEAYISFRIEPMEFTHAESVRVRASPTGTGAGGSPVAVSVPSFNIPGKARKEFEKGNDAARKRDFAEAVKHYQKAVEIYPQFAAAENNLGFICLQTQDYACAREALEKAVSIDPHLARALLNLGRLKSIEKNFGEAESLFQRTLALEPKNPEALTFIAQTELALRKYPDAILYAQRVHLLSHERFAVAHLIAAQAFELQQKLQEAVAEFDMFLREAPKDPRASAVRQESAQLKQMMQMSSPRP
jgi:TolA-binding protein